MLADCRTSVEVLETSRKRKEEGLNGENGSLHEAAVEYYKRLFVGTRLTPRNAVFTQQPASDHEFLPNAGCGCSAYLPQQECGDGDSSDLSTTTRTIHDLSLAPHVTGSTDMR